MYKNYLVRRYIFILLPSIVERQSVAEGMLGIVRGNGVHAIQPGCALPGSNSALQQDLLVNMKCTLYL